METWAIEVPYDKNREISHRTVTQSFVNHIRRGEPMLAPGVEGVRGLELGNAIQMAGLTRKSVDLPLDGGLRQLFKRMRKTLRRAKIAGNASGRGGGLQSRDGVTSPQAASARIALPVGETRSRFVFGQGFEPRKSVCRAFGAEKVKVKDELVKASLKNAI